LVVAIPGGFLTSRIPDNLFASLGLALMGGGSLVMAGADSYLWLDAGRLLGGAGFTLLTLDGGRASLTDHRDKLVVLNFWATWCQPCTVEMPSLEALWRRYRDRGLIVVGVCVDRGAPKALLEPYVRNLKLTFPILLDPDSKTSDRWRVTALPATFLVRPGGEVAGMAMGAREWNSDEMRALVERLLPHPRAH